MYKNMKIEINEQQPLDDVMVELERIEFIVDVACMKKINYVFTEGNEAYCFNTNINNDIAPTTLAELKEM